GIATESPPPAPDVVPTARILTPPLDHGRHRHRGPRPERVRAQGAAKVERHELQHPELFRVSQEIRVQPQLPATQCSGTRRGHYSAEKSGDSSISRVSARCA